MGRKLSSDSHDVIAHAYSPVVEAMASLHALAAPKHHPMHHDWLRTARRRMSAPLKQEAAGFRFGNARFMSACLLPTDPAGDSTGFGAELDRLRSRRAELGVQILRALAGPARTLGKDLLDPMVQALILRDCAHLGPQTFRLIQVGLVDPGRLGERLLSLLHEYWHMVGFQRQWTATEPRLVEAARTASLSANGDGTRGLLALLSDRLATARNPCADGAFDVLVPDGTIIASAHIWPHGCVVNEPAEPVRVVYPVAAGVERIGQDESLTTLTPLLQGLSDSTRLRVLWLVRERPRSTQELACLLGVSQAAVSKHLRLLAQVGLVEAWRDGAYVLYRLVPSSLERVFAGLNGLLIPPVEKISQ